MFNEYHFLLTMAFISLTITDLTPEMSDILVAELSDLGFDGFEERPHELICSIAQSSYDPSNIASVLNRFGVKYSEVVIKEQNWNAVWESNFEPVLVDDFCAIRADFHSAFPDVMHEVIITPKMSFGTGHHATTYMMVSQMQQIEIKGKVVADFGTGTGILAILSEQMGAKEVFALDEDDWSIENARENFSRNNCKVIELLKANAFSANKNFDVILANINRNVILDNLNALSASLVPGAFCY